MTGLAVVVGLYVLYAVVVIALHPRFIYPFDPTPFEDAGFERREVDGVTLYVSRGTEAAPVDAPVILYFMGNAGSLRWFEPMLRHHADAGRRVVAMAYRGGGGVVGRASERGLKADALVAWDALETLGVGAGPVTVHGYSLGTGLAMHVAAERPVDGVLLSAPYARMCDLVARGSGVPACLLPGMQRWLSVALAPSVTAPVLILHGTDDAVVPLTQGLRLAEAFEAAQGAPAKLVQIDGAGHVDLMGFPGYLAEIDAFIAKITRGAARSDF